MNNPISIATQFLNDGKLVAIPTETVYGLAANALDTEAVLSIFEAKKRPFFDPLIVHISGIDQIEKYVRDIPELVWKLAEAFWPGPLTLILPKKDIISDIVTAGSANVGIRIPNHPLALELLRNVPFPLAAPSANPFGYISPTTPEHVHNQLGNDIAYILDGGECTVGLESTIIGFEDDKPIVMRLGGLSINDIEGICGKVEFQLNESSNPSAPGQLKSHYAPNKPFFAGSIENYLRDNVVSNAGVISFEKVFAGDNIKMNWILSPSGDMHQAAHNLFRIMREADDANVECILTEYVPARGLGLAINDRIKRAAAK